jgi:hypothetical protein
MPVKKFETGQRYREVSTGRVIVILDPRVHDIGPSWHYEDEDPVRGWHYCDGLDFYTWGRFELIPDKALK